MARQQVGRGSITRNAPVSFTTGLVTATASSSASGGVPKRARAEDSEPVGSSKGPGKAAKSESASTSNVHPFFLPKAGGATSPIQWLGWLGGTCRHGVHLQPKSSAKVAAFDLDGTLIKPKSGARFAKDHEDWKWWTDGTVIPKKLKELDEEGYAIVIVTNQALGEPPKGKAKDVDARAKLPRFKKFFDKLPLIASAIPTVPFRVFVATAKDQYRKPIPATWFELEKLFKNLNKSYYVGDAAGRDGDHNITDRLYAQNIGIPFLTPERVFLNLIKCGVFELAPLFTPTSTPLIPANPIKPEIVLFVGYPAAGKTSFYKRHFAPAGYVHVNQDTLKTKPKCLAAVREAIANGQSCVVDNTNRDLATRADYHKIARERNVSIRAFVWNVTLDLAWHINLYRAHFLSDDVKANEATREMLGYGVFTQYQNAFQPPTIEEGFSEVKTINWIFQGSEEDRRRFNMYLDVS
ncbi:hypothetical protein FRC04_000981 [Tulasnella sp. 424]|nr:hypothetical protein FRC04_000981 [Tulasnella sp. 424]KAG8977892.1 hypothetical protein FRC05_000420 [Tulasnella sp. 425]